MNTSTRIEFFSMKPSRKAAVDAWYATAYQALGEQDIPRATRLFAVLTLLEPSAERSWIGLGVCHERSGRLNAAAALYALGAKLTNHSSAWLALGQARTLRALGRQTESHAAFARAERLTHDQLILQAIEEERCQA